MRVEGGPLGTCVLRKCLAFSRDSGFVVVQLLSCVRLFATPWTEVRQAPLSFTISSSLLELMSIESVMQSNHLILCRPFLLLPSIITFFFFWLHCMAYGILVS